MSCVLAGAEGLEPSARGFGDYRQSIKTLILSVFSDLCFNLTQILTQKYIKESGLLCLVKVIEVHYLITL